MPEPLPNQHDNADRRLALAYDAATAILSAQDTTLANTRMRANNLLATSALLTSVTTGIGLLNTDPARGAVLPMLGAWLLLCTMVILGAQVLYVLWPVEVWLFGPSASEIVLRAKYGDSEDEIRDFVVGKMIDGIASNRLVLNRKQLAYRSAAVFLIVEVIALFAVLTTAK